MTVQQFIPQSTHGRHTFWLSALSVYLSLYRIQANLELPCVWYSPFLDTGVSYCTISTLCDATPQSNPGRHTFWHGALSAGVKSKLIVANCQHCCTLSHRRHYQPYSFWFLWSKLQFSQLLSEIPFSVVTNYIWRDNFFCIFLFL